MPHCECNGNYRKIRHPLFVPSGRASVIRVRDLLKYLPWTLWQHRIRRGYSERTDYLFYRNIQLQMHVTSSPSLYGKRIVAPWYVSYWIFRQFNFARIKGVPLRNAFWHACTHPSIYLYCMLWAIGAFGGDRHCMEEGCFFSFSGLVLKLSPYIVHTLSKEVSRLDSFYEAVFHVIWYRSVVRVGTMNALSMLNVACDWNMLYYLCVGRFFRILNVCCIKEEGGWFSMRISPKEFGCRRF